MNACESFRVSFHIGLGVCVNGFAHRFTGAIKGMWVDSQGQRMFDGTFRLSIHKGGGGGRVALGFDR